MAKIALGSVHREFKKRIRRKGRHKKNANKRNKPKAYFG